MDDWVTTGKFPPPIDKGLVTRDWGERGYSCDTFVDPPGREWNDFVHATNELVTVVEGRLEMEIEGRTWILGPGDEVFIPRRAAHSVRNVHDATTVWLFGYD